MIIGPEQAFCTNQETCNVLTFNPSLPDGGLADMTFLDATGIAFIVDQPESPRSDE